MRIKYLFATVLNDNPITCPRELATIFILMINTMENFFIVLSIEDWLLPTKLGLFNLFRVYRDIFIVMHSIELNRLA